MKIIPAIFIAAAISGCKLETATTPNRAAFTPANPPEMRRLTDRNSPAYRAAKLFMRGVNLGNYLEASPGQNWGVTFAANECAIMRAEGFDHLRVPVGWQHYAGPAPDFALSPDNFCAGGFRRHQCAEKSSRGDDQPPSFRRTGSRPGGRHG